LQHKPEKMPKRSDIAYFVLLPVTHPLPLYSTLLLMVR
jgi:hypothetical protein